MKILTIGLLLTTVMLFAWDGCPESVIKGSKDGKITLNNKVIMIGNSTTGITNLKDIVEVLKSEKITLASQSDLDTLINLTNQHNDYVEGCKKNIH